MADRKVTFEKLFASKAAAILKLMEEHLIKAGFKTSLVVRSGISDIDTFPLSPHVQDYFIDTGLSLLFPRVELYLQEPDQLLEQVPSPMSGKISSQTVLVLMYRYHRLHFTFDKSQQYHDHGQAAAL